MNKYWHILCEGIPKAPDWRIGWECFSLTPLDFYLQEMAKRGQNPIWHSEGDVLTHTKMVCESLAKDENFHQLSEEKRKIVFLAALFHDIGKVPCTKWENGAWTSPKHTVVGAKLAREVLWRDFELCGNKEEQNVRECICSLIRYHSVPVHLLEAANPERRLFSIAAQGELIPDFSLSLLRILVQADIQGRICSTKKESLEIAELSFLLAEELGILENAGKFSSEVTKYAYLTGRKVWREQELYDDTWGEIILMVGLAGTGKDTWIQEHYANLPMISLDEIRNEYGILPTDAQGTVVQIARERAKAYLRKKQSFVWNATNISVDVRQKQLSLFEAYHARVRIVFLETGWQEGLERNRNRQKKVPETIIGQMLEKLEMPERCEARKVEWHCV